MTDSSIISHPDQPGYFISTDRDRVNLEWVHRWLCNESYWAAGIPLERVRTAIEHSVCFSLYYKDEQVGFARAVTDQATFAYLADVFITESHRGKGLGKWLVETVHADPRLQGLRRWMLMTRDAHLLYEQSGWTRLSPEQAERVMQRHFPDVYKTTGNR